MKTLHVDVGNVLVQVTNPTPAIDSTLTGWFSFRPENFRYDPRYKRRIWDGFDRLYNRDTHCLPAGLLPLLAKRASQAGFTVKLRDTRPALPKRYDGRIHGLEPRNFQREAAEAVMSREIAGLLWPRGVVEIATRGGKTLIMAMLAACYAKSMTLIVVPNKQLLHGHIDELTKFLREPIGAMGDGMMEIQRVTVATINTLDNYREDLGAFWKALQVIIADECHHLPAASWQSVFSSTAAPVRVGFSATAFRHDAARKHALIGMTGDLVYQVAPRELEKRKIISTVRMRFEHITSPESIVVGKRRYMSWDLPWMTQKETRSRPFRPGAYEYLIVKNDARNAQLADAVKRFDLTTLVIVNWLEHGEALAELLDCPFVAGTESTTYRKKILRDIGSGKLRCVVASPIFDEGVTAPAVRHIVLAAGGKSEVKLMQRIGRGRQGSHELLVTDCMDKTNRVLARHSEERLRTGVAEGFRLDTGEEIAA